VTDDIDIDYQPNLETGGGLDSPDQSSWLKVAAQAFRDSTNYYESALYDRWRDNIAHFRSEHPQGSKYTTDAYKHRSKVFRPKARSAERILEATAATALFTNDELIEIRGVDPNNTQQAVAAKLHKAVLQHRMETSIPWFLTSIGAYQDCNVYGICISKQTWKFDKKRNVSYEPAYNDDGTPVVDENGMMLGEEIITEEIREDKPDITLIAPDNFRFDANADWRDVIGTSPYLIELIPMYATDVMDAGKNGDWHEYTLGRIIAAGSEEIDQGETVRDARYGKSNLDPVDADTQNEFKLIWVRHNIIRRDGDDYCFYTVGDTLLLTDPAPLKDVFPHGRELYRLGFSIIETHKTHPSSAIELGRPLVDLINDVTNQRLDNVKLILNKRYKLRRGAKIDVGALMRNVPGGGVLMDDINADIGTFETNDVTSSSYVEQDRLSVEADELFGTFSQNSVQTNRALNETVGGMNLMSASANQIQELQLRTFIETWVEPVLRTMVKLESLYETDETILALAAGAAEYYDQIDDDLMLQDLVVKVNVGMGNTNPQQKLERFMMPIQVASQFTEFAQEIDWLEVGKEAFAQAGQGDGSRFMLTDEKKAQRAQAAQGQSDPRVQIEEMRGQIAQMKEDGASARKQMEVESRERIAQFQGEIDKSVAEFEGQLKKELAEMGYQGDKDLQFDKLKTDLNRTVMQLSTTKELAAQSATAKQMPRPIVEPPQRAPPGQSYQQ